MVGIVYINFIDIIIIIITVEAKEETYFHRNRRRRRWNFIKKCNDTFYHIGLEKKKLAGGLG